MTTEECVVGIDLGTSVVKVGVYTFGGVALALETAPLALRHMSAGRVEQDLQEFYEVASKVCRRCLSENGVDPASVAAIAFSAQMAGVGIVDADHRPLAPFDSWLDNRCGGVVESLAPLTDEILASSGCAPTISIGPKMLWWQKNEPELCSRASSFVTACGFVTARACGRGGSEAVIDPTHLHFTLGADLSTSSWNDILIAKCGLNQDLLPQIVESTQIIGELTADAATDFGLASGIPVAAGCGDAAASALGVGALAPGTALDIAGTAGVLKVGSEEFSPDLDHRTLMTTRAALPGHWYSAAYVSGAGQVVEWICREILGYSVVDEVAYQALEDAVRSTDPGSDGLMMSPHFEGRVAPAAPHMRGALVGLGYSHSRAHIARAALESIANEYRDYLEIVAELHPQHRIGRLIGTGGGSGSGAWNQIKADVLDVDYTPITTVDPGTRGAAIVALVALGHEVPALTTNAFGTVVRPRPEAVAVYDSNRRSHERWASSLADVYSTIDKIGETGQ